MIKIKKVLKLNIALIFTLIGVFLCSNAAYSIDSDFFDKLRVGLDNPGDTKRLLQAQQIIDNKQRQGDGSVDNDYYQKIAYNAGVEFLGIQENFGSGEVPVALFKYGYTTLIIPIDGITEDSIKEQIAGLHRKALLLSTDEIKDICQQARVTYMSHNSEVVIFRLGDNEYSLRLVYFNSPGIWIKIIERKNSEEFKRLTKKIYDVDKELSVLKTSRARNNL